MPEEAAGSATVGLAEALKRLNAALSALEIASGRRLAVDRRGGDLPTELALMQDDRARLAVELDGALARLEHAEAVVAEVDERIGTAIRSVENVLDQADGQGGPRGAETRPVED